jgi:hypothetical protein
LLAVLTENGRVDDAYAIMTRTNYPSLGHMLSFGSKTLAEAWAFPEFPNDAARTQGELAPMTTWFYEWLCGVKPDPAAPGFKHFFIRPAFNVPLTFVKATYHSVRGTIRSEWRKEGGTLTLEVEVPCNTEADVFVSDTDVRHVGGGRHVFRTAWPEQRLARTDRVVHPGEGGVAAEQRVWRVIEKPGERLLVRPAVELQYVTPSQARRASSTCATHGRGRTS